MALGVVWVVVVSSFGGVGVVGWYLLLEVGVRLVGGLSEPQMVLGWFDWCALAVLVMTKVQRNYTLSVW